MAFFMLINANFQGDKIDFNISEIIIMVQIWTLQKYKGYTKVLIKLKLTKAKRPECYKDQSHILQEHMFVVSVL